MARHHNYHVWKLAMHQIIAVAQITRGVSFGDLTNQIRRAAISVCSNIAEGAGRGSDNEFAQFVRIARASNDEVAAQLAIIAAIANRDVRTVLTANESLGRQLSCLLGRLRRR